MKIWLFGVLLVVWGNLLHRLIGQTAALPGGSLEFVIAGAALIAVSVLAARSLGLDASALGLAPPGALRGIGIGVVAGGAVALVAVAATRLMPLVLGAPLVYGPLVSVPSDRLAVHIALFLPLGAVVPEEIAFRGTLLAGLLRRMGVRAAIVASALTFALWHGFVAIVTVADSTLGQTPAWWIIGIAAALVVLFVGGVIMAGLRVATGTLATSIAAHWIFNAVILVGLWSGRAVP
jgi:membrane protease YdiL (CAAX protease family)